MPKATLQLHSDLKEKDKILVKTIKEKFNKLKKRYDEILSTTVNLDQGEKDDTPYKLKVTVLVKTKIKNFVATKTDKVSITAVNESFEAVERQLRKFLDKISHPWEKKKNA